MKRTPQYHCTLFVLLGAALLPPTAVAGTGIFESYIDLNGQFYDMQASTANPDFQGFNLGTFSANGTLTFNGGEIKTFKNGGGNVTGAELDYRIFRQGSGAPGFSTFNLPFNTNLSNPGDQSWRTTGSTLNVIPIGSTSRAAGIYNFEVFGKAFTNEGDRFSNNGGANYIATFIIQATDYTWNGGAGTGATGTPANWVGGIAPGEGHNLHFAGSAQTTITNSFSSLNAIFFDSGASTFTVGGTAITMGNPTGQGGTTVVGNAAVRGIANNSSNNQNVNLNITLGNNVTFNANTSTLALGGSTFVLNGNRITVTGSSNTSISNTTSGSGDILKQGTGTLTLTGANTFGGGTNNAFIDEGTIAVGSGGTIGTTNGTSTGFVNLGASGVNTAANASVLATAGGVTVANPIDVRHFAGINAPSKIIGSNTSGTVTFSGNITLHDSATLTAGTNGTVNFTGVIAQGTATGGQDVNGTPGVSKTGDGTVILSNANTYGGGTSVTAGTLLVANMSGSATGIGSVTVTNSGSTLGGGTTNGVGGISGAVNINPGANLSAGSSTAILKTGALTLVSGSNFLVELNNTIAGTGYDQVISAGILSLSGSNLVVTAANSLMLGDKFYILENSTNNPNGLGTFSNGLTVTANNGYVFAINYADNGDAGTLANDISLTLAAVPEPRTWIAGALTLLAIGATQRRRLAIVVKRVRR